ncbi:MAG: N-6 DNA methylase [Planctomycetia bacterium]|nr:N-6 DNA methylase [Planctomycetia bacterium]
MKKYLPSNLISQATARNWDRLRSDQESEDRLTRRANKKLSQKTVFPKEYFTNPSNSLAIQGLLNRIRLEKLPLKKIISSLCANFLIRNKLALSRQERLISKNPYIHQFLDEIAPDLAKPLLELDLPIEEKDIVGFIYQCLLSEGRKNVQGSYFTPGNIVQTLTKNLDINEQTAVLDPCCGTGSFLLNISGVKPENLYGIDIDPLAAIIAKTNLFVKFKEKEFSPNIFCEDFLLIGQTFFNKSELPDLFDIIISNPPWGASIPKDHHRFYPEITSGESFSFFIVQALRKLKKKGQLCFLLPESVFNVKSHQDVRKSILDKTSIRKLFLFGRCFSGVFTPVVGILLDHIKHTDHVVLIESDAPPFQCRQNDYLKNDHYAFTIMNGIDQSIIDTIYGHPFRTLSESRWALGIVTGNNKEKLHTERKTGMEPIYTGKDVQRYSLKAPSSFIKYERSEFQQIAPDEMYRADEKLVYKFISNRLVFSYDESGSLFLNSANILIPCIEGMSVKTALAFLNSNVLQFLYAKKFGEIKILRGNLEKLPFPIISADLDRRLTRLVDSAREGTPGAHEEIQKFIYRVWKLTDNQIQHLEKSING